MSFGKAGFFASQRTSFFPVIPDPIDLINTLQRSEEIYLAEASSFWQALFLCKQSL